MVTYFDSGEKNTQNKLSKTTEQG